jgi:magnesium chelatase subunit H
MKLAAISPADGATAATPVRVVIVTLDRHLGGVVARAEAVLRRDTPGLTLTLHAATDWAEDPTAMAHCLADIASGDIILATMLFMEDHVRCVLPALQARREQCDAMIGAMSAGEIVGLTKLGPLRLDRSDKGPLALLKRLRGSKGKSSGAGQMAMLRRLPKILRFLPGTAQDLRAYFLTMQYWLAGSEANVCAMVGFLVGRYADGPRRAVRGAIDAPEPKAYPEVGIYHPRLPGRMGEDVGLLPRGAGARGRPAGPALLCAGGGHRPL